MLYIFWIILCQGLGFVDFVLPSSEVCVYVSVCFLVPRMVDVHEEDQQTITVQVEVKREREDEEEKVEFLFEKECVISCTTESR